MVIQTKMTTQDFEVFLANRDDEIFDYELVNGVPIPMSPSSFNNAAIAARIIFLIQLHLHQNNLMGTVTGADGGFEISPNTVRAPDVAYVAPETIVESEATFMPVAPDWVVEVTSPSETHTMIRDKVQQYLEVGTKLIWVVYPDSQSIDVWQRIDEAFEVRTYTKDQSIPATNVLPGLEIAVAEIFRIGTRK